MNRYVPLVLLIGLSIVFPSAPVFSAGANHPAGSANPYFESFPANVPHRKPKWPAIYGQGAFSWNGQPRIALAPDGRIFMAWLASIGFARGDRVVGSYSADGGRTWSDAIELINNPNRDDADPVILVDGKKLMVISTSLRMPETWNKFNPWPVKYDRTWWYLTETSDGGKTWSAPLNFPHPHNYAGHRSNGIRLKNGTLLLPYYDVYNSKEGNIPKLEWNMRSDAGVLRSTDGGKTWTSGRMMTGCGANDCDEPAVVRLANGSLYCLMRTLTRHLYESRSRDDGQTWDTPAPSPIAAGRDVPFALARLKGAGRDELVAAWNYPNRLSLVAAYSPDGGKTWTKPRLLARPNPAAGYTADNPSICQAADGTIVVAWQQETLPRHLGKEIYIARFNRAWLTAK